MISKLLAPIINIARFHKSKMVLCFGLYLVFLYFMFPFNDLGDKVATMINQASGGQVVLSFETMDASLFPQVGITMSEVEVTTPFFPKLSTQSLSLSPSILSLILLKPGVNASAEGLLGGQTDLTIKYAGNNSQKKPSKIAFDSSLDDLQLKELVNFMQSSVKVSGKISGSASGDFDTEFVDQPNSSIEIQGEKIVLADSQIMTTFGPLALPAMNLGDVNLESKMDKGSMEISKLTLGKPGSEFYANITGKIELRAERAGPQVGLRPGNYDFKVQLQFNEALKQKLSLFLGFIGGYNVGANNYAFRAIGSGFYSPPQLSRIQ
ncbi:MAG: type II secretion system protein GspN [Oligoflexia bacterium]|nr:type II secretion system protein GspN [Oligoflexia bacterium]